MSLSSTLFLIFLIFQSVFCENCSEVFLENFRRSFNSSDECGNCTVLKSPESYLDNGLWWGVCSRNRYLMLPKRKCRNSFALVSRNTCEIFSRNNFPVDDDCFAKFIDEKCGDLTVENGEEFCGGNSTVGESKGSQNKRDKRQQTMSSDWFTMGERFDANVFKQRLGVTELTTSMSTSEDMIWTKRTSTEITSTKETERTSTEETTTTSTRETKITSTKATEPTSTKATQSTSTKATEPTSTKATEPTSTKATEPTSTKATQSTSTKATEPTSTKATEPTSTKATEPTSTKATEPTSTKATQSTSTKATEPTTTKATQPTSTKATQSTSTKATQSTSTTATPPSEKTTESKSTEMTQQSTTSGTSAETPCQSTSHPVTKTTKIFESTKDPLPTLPLPDEICEFNEFSFDNHCYFLKLHGKLKEEAQESHTDISDIIISVCSTQHPFALGLAVETRKENEFITRELQRMYFLNQSIVLTSGRRTGDLGGIWFGWNREIDHSFLNFGKIFQSRTLYYTIDPCENYWELWDGSWRNQRLFIMCERPYNPKNIVDDLYKQCIRLYRNSSCYDKDRHSKYCCAMDENGELWFACSGEKLHKSYPYNIKCSWECKNDSFTPFRPVCSGSIACRASHNNIAYVAPIMTYAISSCPKNSTGYSTWYCEFNRTFLGLPDYSLCCESPAICTDTDVFLNVWVGCPSKKIVKKAACPPGSVLNEAYVEWYCHPNGSFNGSTPDYSNCDRSDQKGCSKKDRYGVQWIADLGTTVYKNCPPSFTGECWWKCKESGEFDGAEPDCTWCRAKWMDNIAEKIKSNSHHEEVITAMEEYTEKEDLRIGYGHVLHLTSECVSLYKKQNTKGGETSHHKFLKGYSKVFKNLAGSPTLWSSFSESGRKSYAENVIEITQEATFANLEAGNVPPEPYNATLTDLKTDGFDFFVAYNPSIKGCKFPLENPSESDWNLEIKEVTENNSNFAAMGLIMNYSLSSLMFPQGEETGDKEMNAPALTFAVAFSRDGKAVVDPNVKVSVSFKHINKTRFPEMVEIRRKLHKGEKPSGVFNSTVCCYYSDSGWSADGCSVTYTSRDRTDCVCTHLSTIGLLMSIHKYVPDTTLEIISVTSSGITILSLILALIVFYFFDTMNNDRVLIGKNLCFCLLVGHVMLITVLDKKFFYIPDESCKIYAVLLHYVFMAAFAWMFVEGCHLYRMLVLVFDSNIEYRFVYLLIGYGVPLLIVGATHLIGFAFQEQPYGQDELCWLKHPNYIWAFIGPVIIITSVNFYILIIAMKLAISSRIRTEHSNLTSFKLWLKGWFTLSSLLGITWLFGLALISYNKIFIYGFVVFNGLQGFFIFLFRCALNDQYNDVFLKKIKSFSSSFNSRYKKDDAAKSDTKVITISASKSLTSSETKTRVDGSESEAVNCFLNKKTKSKPDVENAEVDVNAVEINLKAAVSEARLRNRMLAHNFAARRSKATWMNECNKFR